jgi:hypothetical protein
MDCIHQWISLDFVDYIHDISEPARRFVTVAVGTIYPIPASTVCIATNSNTLNTSSVSSNRPVHTNHEETFWLTYWCCYSILFVMMDYLETFVGYIPGFYSICLCATVDRVLVLVLVHVCRYILRGLDVWSLLLSQTSSHLPSFCLACSMYLVAFLLGWLARHIFWD